MGQISAKAMGVLDARPEDVYATIADYHVGHASILPKKSLYDLQVEQGRHGAGTIIRFKARMLGVEQSFHHRVSQAAFWSSRISTMPRMSPPLSASPL